jgi:hypothetical protein
VIGPGHAPGPICPGDREPFPIQILFII